MKKKIAILTFQKTWNPGASLQAYALQEAIKKIDLNSIDVKHINYVNDHVISSFQTPKFTDSLTPKKFIKFILSYKKINSKDQVFRKFDYKHINLSERIEKNRLQELNKKFDMFITGSDQIFNHTLTNSDDTFFLDFVDENKIRASYAASFGKIEYFQEKFIKYSNFLKKFDTVSLREQDAADFIQKNVPQLNAKLVLDPTFLISANEWETSFPEILEPLINQKYILVYTVNPASKIIEFAKKIAKEKNLKIVYLNNGWKRVPGMKNIYNFGPIEFLNYIRNAEYVLITSFHGLAFAIQFNKQFAVEMIWNNHTGSTRLKSLMDQLAIYNRDIIKIDDPFKTNIEYTKVMKKLNTLKGNSLNVLKEIIGD